MVSASFGCFCVGKGVTVTYSPFIYEAHAHLALCCPVTVTEAVSTHNKI